MSEKRLLDFEQAISATGVADVQIAPDGSAIAYVTSPLSKEDEHPVSEIWLVPAEGESSRRLTTSEAADGFPRWAPGSDRIAFVSDRKNRGTGQLYLIDLAGGEAVRLTDCDGGVAGIAWSPNGRKLAFTALDAETEEEKKRREERDDANLVEGNIKRASLWTLTVPDDPASLGELPKPTRLSPDGMHVGGEAPPGFSWAPDGQALTASVSPSPKANDTFSPDLVTISLDGEVTNLGQIEGMLSTPKFSADGSTIAFVAAEETIPALFSIQTIPATGGEPKVLAPEYEGSFYGFDWLPDDDRLIAGVETGQSHSFHIIDPETGGISSAFEPFDRPGSGAFLLSASADGKSAAFAHSDDLSFSDVYAADLGSSPRKLTDLNPWVRDYEYGETREVRWSSTDGLEIQGLLILPVGYQEGERYPLLLHIHGGPCGAWTHHLYAGWHDWGQFMAQRGYAVLMPNPRGSSGRGTKFLCGIVGCYGEPDWDDLITGVDHVIDLGIADPDQLVVGGWSGGGFLTNWTITHSDRFKAAISGAGISNWVSFQGTADVRGVFDRYLGPVAEEPENHWRLSPVRSIASATTPTLILFGEADQRVPVSQGHELYEGLKSQGVETEFVTYPREGHPIMERKHQLDLLNRVVDWYDRHLDR